LPRPTKSRERKKTGRTPGGDAARSAKTPAERSSVKHEPTVERPPSDAAEASDAADVTEIDAGQEADEDGDTEAANESPDTVRDEGDDGPATGESESEDEDTGESGSLRAGRDHGSDGHTGRGANREAGASSSIERFDALAMYLREVQRHPLLPAEETQALAVKFVETQDSAAAARLVTANLRLVVKIAYEYRRAYKNIMDLIQEGNIGLMQAVKRYDPYRGVKLSSYAAWWIRAYILRFILNNWRLVKLGTTQAQRKLFFNLRKKRAELQALGVDPSNAEIAKQLNVPENEVEEMDVRLQSSEKSLDAPVGDAEGRAISKVDMMPSLTEGPESIMADGELQALLKEKLAEFRGTLDGKDKELAIFDERLVADEPLTLQELGDRFGISRERVRQLEQRLTGRLREYLREEMGDAVGVA
jgi:RNA polymerase sigma-32 factor